MTDLAQLTIVAVASIPVIAIALLTRAARHRFEQLRDERADWLRPGSSTFHGGSE